MFQSQIFVLHVILFNPQMTLWGRLYFSLHFTKEGVEAQGSNYLPKVTALTDRASISLGILI